MDNDDRGVYYNKTMIKAAGAKDPWDDLKGKWTLDDMLEIAKLCTKKDASGKITSTAFSRTTRHRGFRAVHLGMGGTTPTGIPVSTTTSIPAW